MRGRTRPAGRSGRALQVHARPRALQPPRLSGKRDRGPPSRARDKWLESLPEKAGLGEVGGSGAGEIQGCNGGRSGGPEGAEGGGPREV